MIVKHIPEDFLVQEVLVADSSPTDDGLPYLLFTLHKKGYSTFDAMIYIEQYFGIEGTKAAGLKDSDGVTTQKISVPASYKSMLDRLSAFNRDAVSENRFIHLSFIGYAAVPLKVARLEGNVFRLKLRDMEPQTADRWYNTQIYSLTYPNYFDKQRFGMPNHLKRNHLIGIALAEKDYDRAYGYLKEAGFSEADLPCDGDYEKLFEQMYEPRKRSFYESARYSYEFNTQLGNILEKNGPVCTIEDEEISFIMPSEKKTMAVLFSEEFPEHQIVSSGEKTEEQEVPRKLLVHTNINFLACEPDEFFPGRSVLTISFFLPMGAYATMAVKQLSIFLGTD